MSRFVENPIQFAAECVHQEGRCVVARENILFLDAGDELAAVEHLQKRCGHVVIMPHASDRGHALLYHTSCQRMTDVVRQIFHDDLEAPASLPQSPAEMTLGVMQRHRVTLPYEECRGRVERFSFEEAAQA
jgi:hypothetical protein